MSYFDKTKNIPKFGGDIWYVNKGSGSDTNTGRCPDCPFETIGAAITAMAAGDAISIKAGTYTEANLDLSKASTEMWCEIGTIIDTAAGATALIVSGLACKVTGGLKITPDDDSIGMLISGNECVIEDVKILEGANNFSVTGSGAVLRRCAAGFSKAGTSGFNVTGIQARLYSCSTVGDTTSYGFNVTGSATGVLSDCTSSGHQTSGYYLGSGTTNWTIVDCSTGAGDGRWTDVDNVNIWSGFSYPETKYKEITLDASTNYNLFKLTGAVEILQISGHVTQILEGINEDVYLDLYSDTVADANNITLKTGADLGTAVVGSVVMKTEDPNKKITFFDGAGVGVDKGADPKKQAVVLNADPDVATYIRWNVTTGDTGGKIDFHIVWRPLTDDGFIAVA